MDPKLIDFVRGLITSRYPKVGSYLAALGLLGYAVYEFSQANYDPAARSLMAGLGMLGILHGIDVAGGPPQGPAPAPTA